MYISLYLLLKLFQSSSLPSQTFFIFYFTTLQNLLAGDWLYAQFYMWEILNYMNETNLIHSNSYHKYLSDGFGLQI